MTTPNTISHTSTVGFVSGANVARRPSNSRVLSSSRNALLMRPLDKLDWKGHEHKSFSSVQMGLVDVDVVSVFYGLFSIKEVTTRNNWPDMVLICYPALPNGCLHFCFWNGLDRVGWISDNKIERDPGTHLVNVDILWPFCKNRGKKYCRLFFHNIHWISSQRMDR